MNAIEQEKATDSDFEEIARAVEKILDEGMNITLNLPSDCITDDMRLLQDEHNYNRLHNERVKLGKCGRCGSRPCVCE